MRRDIGDANRPTENRRESALTMRREARPFYAVLFVLQTFALIARRFYLALMEESDGAFWQTLAAAVNDGKVLDIAAVSLSELERDGAKAVISTIVLMEVWDAMMATRDAVNDWLEKRREKARASQRASQRVSQRVGSRAAPRAGRNWPPKSRPGTSEDWPPKRTEIPLTNRLPELTTHVDGHERGGFTRRFRSFAPESRRGLPVPFLGRVSRCACTRI